MRLVRVVAIACGLACGVVSPAFAGEWIISPLLGTLMKLDTNLAVVEAGAGSKKLTIGGAGGFLTDGVFGVEAHATYTFRPFLPDNPLSPSQASAVGTFTGDALFAVPLSISHESLRPYAVVGVGVIHASLRDIILFQPVDRNLAGLDVGGGAIGFLNRRAGFRFDVRRFSSLTQEPSILPKFGGSRLSFWVASVGVILRY